MSKVFYIQSYYPYEHEIIEGLIIPKRNYSEYEMQMGKRSIIEVTEEQLNVLKTAKVFNALVQSKKYRILDNIPKRFMTTHEVVKEKDKKITDLENEVNTLKKQLEEK